LKIAFECLLINLYYQKPYDERFMMKRSGRVELFENQTKMSGYTNGPVFLCPVPAKRAI
jgi:hypothetical protein